MYSMEKYPAGGGANCVTLRPPIDHLSTGQISKFQNKNSLMFGTNTKEMYYYGAIRYNIFLSNPEKKKNHCCCAKIE